LYIVESLKRVDAFYGNIALTIGNFEGYHLGHASVVNLLVEEAKKRRLFPAVMSFKQHPLKVLKGREPSKLWASSEKIKCFLKQGIVLFIYLNFNRELADTPAHKFLKMLHGNLNPKILCLGESFRFGKENLGGIELVEKQGKNYGYDLLTVKEVIYQGAPVSSTRIRKTVKEGNIEQANQMLGRPYSIYLKKYNKRDGFMRPFIENITLPGKGQFKGFLKGEDRKLIPEVIFEIRDGFFYSDKLNFGTEDILYNFCFTESGEE